MYKQYLTTIDKIKTTLNLYKPAHVRMCILELSKAPMYEFLYDYIKDKYGKKSRLLFTDTDSLMYEIETKNVYGDFRKNEEMFHFSTLLSQNIAMTQTH